MLRADGRTESGGRCRCRCRRPDRAATSTSAAARAHHRRRTPTGSRCGRRSRHAAIGLLLGLECTLNPFMANPVYREIAGLPAAEQAAIMRDPAFRERRARPAGTGEQARSWAARSSAMFDRMFELGDPPDYEPDASTSIAARGRARRSPADEFAYDLLAADDGRTMLYVPFLNYVDGSLDAVGEMLAHPHTVPGPRPTAAPTSARSATAASRRRCSPCGAATASTGRWACRSSCSGSAATRRARSGCSTAACSRPATGPTSTSIDFDGPQLRRPEMHFDLPAGGKRLLQQADGYRHTFVSGIETYTDGEHTGALPGRLVRGAQPAPTS